MKLSSFMSHESLNEEVVTPDMETQEAGESSELISDPFGNIADEDVQAELDLHPELLASLIKPESE